jgi:hypothetical protein
MKIAMRSANKFIFALAIFFIAVALVSCSKDSDEKSAATPEKSEAQDKSGVTIDAAAKERIGLKIDNLVETQWQPQLRAIGNVADPLAFTAAAADFESARAAAEVSRSELERTQKLADQNNASARALETAQAAATHDSLALKSAQAKFTADWGAHLAAQTNLTAFAENFQGGNFSLVKLSPPVGAFLNPPPPAALIFLLGDETNFIAAKFADNLGIDPATQSQTLLFSVDKKLPPNAAVTGFLKISGEAIGGVIVPASAVLRHEGKGWIYVQTETNQFVRTEIPLDRLMENGWFVSENLSATNRIVVSGAQTILSAELSNGGFTTGERD